MRRSMILAPVIALLMMLASSITSTASAAVPKSDTNLNNVVMFADDTDNNDKKKGKKNDQKDANNEEFNLFPGLSNSSDFNDLLGDLLSTPNLFSPYGGHGTGYGYGYGTYSDPFYGSCSWSFFYGSYICNDYVPGFGCDWYRDYWKGGYVCKGRSWGW